MKGIWVCYIKLLTLYLICVSILCWFKNSGKRRLISGYGRMALIQFSFWYWQVIFKPRVEWIYSCVKIWEKDFSDRVKGYLGTDLAKDWTGQRLSSFCCHYFIHSIMLPLRLVSKVFHKLDIALDLILPSPLLTIFQASLSLCDFNSCFF